MRGHDDVPITIVFAVDDIQFNIVDGMQHIQTLIVTAAVVLVALCLVCHGRSVTVQEIPLRDGRTNGEGLLIVIEDRSSETQGERTVHREVDPLWDSLLPTTTDTFLHWSICGGLLRPNWQFDGVSSDIAFSFLLNDLRHHATCTLSQFLMCAPRSSIISDRQYAIVASLSALSSSPMRWTSETPMHQRPVGLTRLSSRGTTCSTLTSSMDTLCSQHLGFFNPDVNRLLSQEFLLNTSWHQIKLSVRRDGGHIEVIRNVYFVLSSSWETGIYVDRMKRTCNQWPKIMQREVLPRNPATLIARPTVAHASFEASMISKSDLGGELRLQYCSMEQHGVTARVLMVFPTTVFIPQLRFLHKRNPAVNPRIVKMHFDADLGSLLVVIDMDVSVPVNGSSECTIVRIPYKAAFARLSERPPDANKRYSKPQPIIRTERRCSEAAASDEWTKGLDQLMHLPGEPRRCYRYLRSSPSGSLSASLPVPDPAMVFNVLSIGMLPFAVLMGTVLRRTGRDTN